MPVVADGILGRNSMFYQVDPEFITVEEGFNPRLQFDETEHESLKAFGKENGVPWSLLCRKGAGDRILLVDGERRLRAVRALNEGGC